MDERDPRIDPPAEPLADELRRGLHIADPPRKSGDTDRASILRCVQAALLKIADRIYEVDRRRSEGLQHVYHATRTDILALHERISAVLHQIETLHDRLRVLEEAALADERFEAGRKAEILARREQETLERGEKSYWLEFGKFAIALMTAVGTVFGVIWAVLQMVLQAQ